MAAMIAESLTSQHTITPAVPESKPTVSLTHSGGVLRLAAEHLVKVYKRRRVVRDVSVDIKQGEIVGLLGPNGAGKTTAFYMIVGLVQPDGGRVTLGSEEI